jgi:hypothetical protein
MSLSANRVLEQKIQPVRHKVKIVDGTVHVYKGALLNFEGGNIGYAQPATDTLTEEFAGIALDELNVAAADNAADGTYEIDYIPCKTEEWQALTVHDTITVANIGDPVYVYDDEKVSLSATNTTGGKVGIIAGYLSANKAWIQMTK